MSITHPGSSIGDPGQIVTAHQTDDGGLDLVRDEHAWLSVDARYAIDLEAAR